MRRRLTRHAPDGGVVPIHGDPPNEVGLRRLRGLTVLEKTRFSGREWREWSDSQLRLDAILDAGEAWAQEVLVKRGLPTKFYAGLIAEVADRPHTQEWFAVKVLRSANSVRHAVKRGDAGGAARAMYSFTADWLTAIFKNDFEEHALKSLWQGQAQSHGGMKRSQGFGARNSALREEADRIRKRSGLSDNGIAEIIAKEWTERFPSYDPLGASRIRTIIRKKHR